MRPAFPRSLAVALRGPSVLAVLFVALAVPSRAEEDPLLGRIRVIQCVGCTPGSVDLIVHDPIDVRDFQVRINESDYQKIITPLPGKTVYEKSGCFYWFEAPKSTPAQMDSAKGKKAGKPAKLQGKQDSLGQTAPADSNGPSSRVPASAPEVQGIPSRCIPFVKVEAKPAIPDSKKD